MGEVRLPTVTTPDRELVKEIAMDIGKEAVSHLRLMYPAAYAVLGPSGRLSLRNTVHNEIMAALATTDAEGIRDRLEQRRRERRTRHRMWDRFRDVCPAADTPPPSGSGHGEGGA